LLSEFTFLTGYIPANDFELFEVQIAQIAPEYLWKTDILI